jgi:hypothetical protein
MITKSFKKFYSSTMEYLSQEQRLYYLRVVIGTSLYYVGQDYLTSIPASSLLKNIGYAMLFSGWIYSFMA